MNIEHRTSNHALAWGKDEKTEFIKPELLDDILQETEELIKIFNTPHSPLKGGLRGVLFHLRVF